MRAEATREERSAKISGLSHYYHIYFVILDRKVGPGNDRSRRFVEIREYNSKLLKIRRTKKTTRKTTLYG